MLHIETGTENEVLRQTAETIKKSEWSKYVKIGKEMVKYIKNPKHAGVWLAAPQIGISKRMIVVSLLADREDDNFSTVLMINPKITEASTEMTTEFVEWCLSLPDAEKVYLSRHLEIKLQYQDEKGKEKNLRLRGLSSVIVQHEIDHLDGVLYVDRIGKK